MTRQGSIDRREFLRAAAVAPLGAALATPGRRAEKPNLLFLWADQHLPDTMSVYGNTKTHAPNFNRLAEECVVFENAYVTQPICTPSRSSVTGLWPHTNGCNANDVRMPAGTRFSRASEPELR